MNMKGKCHRIAVAGAAVLLALNVSAFVPLQFFAPMPPMQSQDQLIRQFAAAQGLDVSDVPAGQMTKELLHGSYDMTTGCPGCKGNVDYGSGKQMYCSKHNLKFDSALGCPLCNRIGDEGRFAPTWR